ncbi:MAG: dipeptidase [Acetivibrionales bacterium]|jgi:membrane dipeptidase|nr:membrane dipeptidase [Clostridiaceae bacterium]
MFFFDAHCDILSAISEPEEFFTNKHHWDAERALSNGPFIQVLSLFAEGKSEDEIKKKMDAQLATALLTEEKYPERMKIIRKNEELSNWEGSVKSPKIGCIIEAEGAEVLGGSLSELDRLYEAGLRILTLSWNYDNAVCDSIAGNNRHNGLSAFGRQVINRAETLGVVIDLSHASDKTFSDVEEISTKPFIASHSNSRSVCKYRRNLTDKQINSIAKRGGVIGINLCPDFLNNSGNADIMDIIRHIEYISALVGTSCLGFGCDFDGIDSLPAGISGVQDMSRIVETLLRFNYKEEDVKGIAGLNFKRLFNTV